MASAVLSVLTRVAFSAATWAEVRPVMTSTERAAIVLVLIAAICAVVSILGFTSILSDKVTTFFPVGPKPTQIG